MTRKEPSKLDEMQYAFLAKRFLGLLCAAGFIAIAHQLLVRPFFPGKGLELLTGGVMIGVVFIGIPIAFIKSRRDARRLCPIEATTHPPETPPST